jgi:hypothetical protein
MDDALIEGVIRARLHAEASALSIPEGLASRIMRAVRLEANGADADDAVASLLQADAHEVRAPRDMSARVRSAVRDREERRLRFQPGVLVGPAVAVLGIAAIVGFVSLLPRDEDQGVGVPSSAVSGSSEGEASSNAQDDQSLTQSLPPNTLVPAWVPEDYAFETYSQLNDSFAPFTYRLENGEGGYISIELMTADTSESALEAPQAAFELPDADAARGRSMTGTMYHDGVRLFRTDGTGTVSVAAGDQRVTITANQLSDPELLRLARSMGAAGDANGDSVP